MAGSTPFVAAESIRLLSRYVPAVLAANVINGGLVVIALWSAADRRVLLGWSALVFSLTAIRGALWLADRRRLAEDETAIRRGPFNSVASAISGVLWGSTAFLFIQPDNPVSLILVAFVIGGMGAGAVTSLSAYLPAFYLYLFCSVLPLKIRLLILGGTVDLVMAGMLTVYAISLMVIGHRFNEALMRALELNEENKRLLATREQEVRMRTADLQTLNADLEREIVERKAAEARMEVARADAVRANDAKSRFLAAARHDLRQPLQSMFLFAASLYNYVVDAKGLNAVVRIERGLDILKRMLDSLLDLSRLDVNVIEAHMAIFRLKPIMDDIVASYSRVAASKGIELRCGASADTLVRSDQILLGRMLRNPVENALRYSEHGFIELSSGVEGDRVRLEVKDTGIGIAPDQLGRIFEEFHQIGNPERDKSRGLGLGLAIVQRLSLLLDHPVEVRSEFGLGSTFTILLPTVIGSMPDQPGNCAAAPERFVADAQILTIDDDPMVLLGHQARRASSHRTSLS